jgi:hypothetical protein
MAEENKKKSGLKKALKTTLLVGAGVVAGIAIAKPEETKNVVKTGWNKLAGFCGGLFKKKTAEPCEVDADLSEATTDANVNNEVRSGNNGNGWYNRPNNPKFNNNKH